MIELLPHANNQLWNCNNFQHGIDKIHSPHLKKGPLSKLGMTDPLSKNLCAKSK